MQYTPRTVHIVLFGRVLFGQWMAIYHCCMWVNWAQIMNVPNVNSLHFQTTLAQWIHTCTYVHVVIQH